ncbi:hypothetical protein KAH94_01845 [bacterium]|nr:hypothetical protein [bacterium]
MKILLKSKGAKAAIVLAIAALALIALNDAFGRYKRASSAERFERALEENYVVALLYAGKPKKGMRIEKSVRNRIKSLRKTFKRISSLDPYNYAEIMFVTADVSQGKLFYIPQDYKLEKPTLQEPIFVLFKGGAQVATIKGFLSTSEIRAFIDKNFRNDIAQLVKQKDAREKRRLREARRRSYDRSYRWAPYYGGSWGFGWPYRGYGWGGGFGFRRGWGHRGWGW